MENNKGLIVLAVGAAAFVSLSNMVSSAMDRIIIGDIEMINYNIHLLETDIHFEMPVKNASESNLSFDGFVGNFEVRGHSIANVNILETVTLTAGQIVKIPITVKVYTTTILGEALAFWEQIKVMLQTRRFNEEAFLKGTVYAGALDFSINQRIF